MIVIRVALPVPLRQHFDYLVAKHLVPAVGCRVLVPFGSRQLVGIVWQVAPDNSFAINKLKTVINVIDQQPVLPPLLRNLLSFAAEYYHYPLGEVLISALPALLREGRNLADYQPLAYRLTPAGKILESSVLRRAKQQHALWQALQQSDLTESMLLQQFSRAILNQLLKKELVAAYPVPPVPFAAPDSLAKGLQLTPNQALAVTAINQAKGRFERFLIEGVTGSGKTEVYLQCIAGLLMTQQQVLVIVPEIGLTPQTLARFQARFDLPILCWHSALTDSERLHCWQQAATGAAAIIIGTRSALFLPFMKLGLIIIDEEHDQSLKQQDGFSYHARDLAIKRAALEHCPIVLGSATPSLESLYNADSQRFIHLDLPDRATGHKLPQFKLVDLKQQVLQFGLADISLAHIRKQLSLGQQVMLFLNRRGFAPALSCQECGWLTECHRCSAFTTYHKQSRQLICHHCGASKAIPRQCGDCGSTQLIPLGQGTEQLEQNLQTLFPDTAITRLDRDSTRRKGALHSALDDIHSPGARLIVGTQMLAKGHHFPNVSLVVIVDVDGALYSSDFRAPEQLAQLLTQVAGRAGRGGSQGTVLLQTQYPEHSLLQDIIQNGYAAFARSALLERKHTQLPPYQYLALFRAEAHDTNHCQQWLTQLADLVHNMPQLQLLGPIPSPLERRAGKYRWQLQLYSINRTVLHNALDTLLAQLLSWPLTRKVKWQLDVDPIDLS
ncbi:primosomal protein N' [Rheinheimera salexigens]|uniref:Replication restart protein PriA n=1 Tax=Rheinheimera salexigens TaxID=1628148 RepID=A0A1E7Q9T4_9GAMM|nr:primosomal protein N' [Rheinheimera salexigens]OEY70952.1 primosomal protein N' [Rheinheimera salexigens]